MFVGFGTQLNFFNLDMNLFFSGFLLFFALLILELAVVHYAAYRRFGRGRHLNQIQLLLLREFKRLGYGKNAKLFAVGTNNPDLGCMNALIDVYGRFCYGCTS